MRSGVFPTDLISPQEVPKMSLFLPSFFCETNDPLFKKQIKLDEVI